jgi:hypothetical protein
MDKNQNFYQILKGHKIDKEQPTTYNAVESDFVIGSPNVLNEQGYLRFPPIALN